MKRSAGDSLSFEGESHEKLLEEIQHLRAELQKKEHEAQATAKRRARFGLFTARVGLKAFSGSQLYEKTVHLWDEWSAWLRTGPTASWPEASTRDFAAALLARVSRIGIVFLIFAVFPFVITLMQLVVLIRQNELIDQQTELAESARRSALIFEQTAILDEIDEELDGLPAAGTDADDSVRVHLSPRLEGRIVALSRSLRPYRYLDGEQLTSQALSPERGQLLLALVNSRVDMTLIVRQAAFDYADLPDTRIDGFDLGGGDTLTSRVMKHTGSFWWANFQRSQLTDGSFRDAQLFQADFRDAWMEKIDFVGALLTNANFADATLVDVDFRDATLVGVNFKNTSMFAVDLTQARSGDLRAFAAQLCRARTISGKMAPALLAEMRKDKACTRKIEAITTK